MSERSVNYESISKTYDRRYQENDYSGILESLLKFVTGAQTGELLEVGCGTGHWIKELVDRGYNITGLEPARGMLKSAREKDQEIPLIQGQAEALPFKDGSFNRVLCINAFHHFTDKEVFFKEAFRVLKSGGGLITFGLDPHTGLDRWWIYDYFPQAIEIDKKRYLPASKIREMMREYGFVKCRIEEVLHMPIKCSAREALKSGKLGKSTTSQLAILTDDEYNQGLGQLKRDIEAAEAQNQALTIYADLRLYATVGWKE